MEGKSSRADRRLGVVVLAIGLGMSASAAANQTALPPCLGGRDAPEGSYPRGEIQVTGNGGLLDLKVLVPGVDGVSPMPTEDPFEADVVDATLSLSLDSVVGAGTTKVHPAFGLPPLELMTHTGAQKVTVSPFTGHIKSERKVLRCASIENPGKDVEIRYSKLTLTGLLTPMAAGSPAKEWAEGYQIDVKQGDNGPK